MGTITTTTSDAVTDPGQGRTDVQSEGTLWHCVRRSSGNLGFFYSKNNGSTWTDAGSGSDINISNAEVGAFYIDQGDFASLVVRQYSSGADRVFYYYGRPDTARTSWSWFSGVQLFNRPAAASGNGIQKLDVVTIANPYPSGGPALVIVAAGGGTDVPNVVTVGWFVNNYGTVAAKGLFSYDNIGAVPCMPSIDFRHTGDDKHRANPIEFLVCTGSGSPDSNLGFYRVIRFLWDGSKFNNSNIDIKGSLGQEDNALGGAPLGQTRRVVRIDAQGRALVPHINGTSAMALTEIDVSRTTKTVRTLPTHPQGVVKDATVNYDNTGNVYVYATGTSTNQVYLSVYTRLSDTWSGWSAVGSATFDSASWGARRNASNNRLDTWTQTGSGTFTLSSQQGAITAAPLAPSWVTATTLASNTGSATTTTGLVANVASALPLDWNFIDPDPTDTQSAYAVSRQIGAGALAYWRASDSTWQAAEVKNVSTTSAITVASGWGSDSDANHTYKVKVWDSADLASVYSAGLVITPSAVANPTITAPAASAVITTSSTTLTWTVSQQTKYRVVLERNVGSFVTVFDQTVTDSAARSYLVSPLENGGSYRITLYTVNNEGLWSAATQVSFTVSFTPPNTPTMTFPVLDPMYDYIVSGLVANPAGGISVLSNDIDRREYNDDTTIISLVTGLGVNGQFYDATVKARTRYQYRVIAHGSNGSTVTTSWFG